MKNYLNSSKNRRKSFLSNKKKIKDDYRNESGDISHNNRELATALSKARSQIRELENEKVRFCGERQELMEKVSTLKSEIEKCRSTNDDGEITPNSKILVKEISQSLHSQLAKAAEWLLECSSYLANALGSVDHIQGVCSHGNDGKNLSQYFTGPSADILSPKSDENAENEDPALSLTIMTPSNSSASSDDSLPSDNGIDNNIMLSPVHHDEPNHQQDTMDIDAPHIIPSPDNIVVCSTPNHGLTKSFNSVVCKLAVTPEDCISHSGHQTFSDSKKSAKRLQSPISSIDKRVSKRRNVRQNFCYKEPSLTRKLRQGDPFTDKSLFSPGHVRLGKQRQYASKI